MTRQVLGKPNKSELAKSLVIGGAASAQRDRERTAAVADIGPITAVVNPRRRERCRFNLLLFLVTYFPNSTGLSPFGDDHKKMIARIRTAILEGGRFVNATYRGAAKTTIAENAVIWATLYGHRKFVPIFTADASLASGIVESIKLELSENELLAEDFPEVSHAIAALEGKSQRCRSQTQGGRLTHIDMTADTIILPTITFEAEQNDDTKLTSASGAIISAFGITGSIRGLKHKRADGTQQRPDFVIVDDPQSDEAASSPLQIEKRLKVIRKTILRLAGHGRSIAVVINATVIQTNDLVDQLLDHERNPVWQSERMPMVKTHADALKTL